MTELNRLLESGHRKLSAEERASVLGLAPMRQAFEAEFAVATQHASQARTALRAALGGDPWLEARDRVDVQGPEFARAVDGMRNVWIDALARTDGLTGADSGEMLSIFDRVAETAKGRGVDGLLNLFEEQLSEFDEVMTSDRDYGRQPHSPLEWWKWLIIIAILVIALAALIVCLWWFGCSWIYAIFAGLCWGAFQTGGVLVGPCITVFF